MEYKTITTLVLKEFEIEKDLLDAGFRPFPSDESNYCSFIFGTDIYTFKKCGDKLTHVGTYFPSDYLGVKS